MLVLREAFLAIRRTPLSATLIALAIGVNFGLTSIFAYLAQKADRSLEDVKQSVFIDVYFDETIPSEAAWSVAKSVMEDKRSFDSARFISKQEALAEYEATTGQNVEAVLGANPLPASLHVLLRDVSSRSIDRKMTELRQLPGVKEVGYDQKLLKTLEDRAKTLRSLMLALGGLLLGTAILVTVVATRLAVETRREALRTFSLMGATRYVLQTPFAIEGMISGLIGGLLAVGLFFLLDQVALSAISPELGIGKVLPSEGLLIGGLVVIAAAFLGGVTSWLSSALLTRKL